MRWMVEQVTFETAGMDHSAANGSKAVSERVVREIYNYEPPVFTPYNFIGIKGGGAKMSSSKGNVLTLTDLLKVYDKNIILWFYAKYDTMHAFDIALDNDVIRYYGEFDRYVKMYFNNTIDDKNRAIIEQTGVTKDYLNNPNFSYLATFLPIVNYNEELLKELLRKEQINCDTKEFSERLSRAKYWVETYGKDYQVKLLEEKNIEVYDSLSPLEKSWLEKTKEILENTYQTSEELQKELYSVVKTKDLSEEELKSTQKRYFQILYNLLLGTSKGPKLGLFLLALDKDKVKELI